MATLEERQYMESVKMIAHKISLPKTTDWEERRYRIAKDALAALVPMELMDYPGAAPQSERKAKLAVEYADALIHELRGDSV